VTSDPAPWEHEDFLSWERGQVPEDPYYIWESRSLGALFSLYGPGSAGPLISIKEDTSRLMHSMTAEYSKIKGWEYGDVL
jgi:hypothetical protein